MSTIFKTNINCGNCINAVTPALNKKVGEGKWSVDTTNENKLLTITTEVKAEEIQLLLKRVGFQAELLS